MEKKTKNGGKAAALAAMAAAGAAAGYYFYASTDAKKNRKVAAKWANDMKAQVVKTAKQAKKLDRATIEKIVMSTAKTVQSAQANNREEVMRAAKELKANWQELLKELGAGTAKKAAPKKIAKKAPKKTVKATSKKSAAKKS